MAEKSTAFAVIGDRYHNSDYIRTALSKTLVGDLGLTIDFTDDVKSLNAETLRGYKNADNLSRWHDLAPRLRRSRIAATKYKRTTVPEVEATAIDWITEPQAQAVKILSKAVASRCFTTTRPTSLGAMRPFAQSWGQQPKGIRPFDRSRSHSLTQTTPSLRVRRFHCD